MSQSELVTHHVYVNITSPSLYCCSQNCACCFFLGYKSVEKPTPKRCSQSKKYSPSRVSWVYLWVFFHWEFPNLAREESRRLPNQMPKPSQWLVSTLSSSWMKECLTLFLRETTDTQRRKLISDACIHFLILFVIT